MDTLDPKKKKIYIAVILLCLLTTGGVLMYGFGGGGGSGAAVDAPAPTGLTPVSPTPGASPSATTHAPGVVPQVTTKSAYPAPSVFPAEPQFDLDIYGSGALTDLSDYVPLTVNESDIGRENPFITY